jgi:hypothetical protein
MPETHDRPPESDLYEYFRGMSLEEITNHLDELKEELGAVKKYYTGPIRKHIKIIKDDDMDKLSMAIGDLLPMTHNPEVQQEVISGDSSESKEPVLWHISDLTMDILTFMTRFDNSGATILRLDA